jgi:hypothetical protein
MNTLYLFLDNKYTSIYFKLIKRAKVRTLEGYGEKHHIIPTALLKTDNVVKLTAREHLLCHLLLTKMTEGNANHKMQWALNRMMSGSKTFHPGRQKSTSRVYEQARLKFIELLKRPKSEDHKRKISEALKGHAVTELSRSLFIKRNSRPHSQETKDKMSKSAKGKQKTEEMKAKLSKSKTGIKRAPFSEEWKQSLSIANKGRPKSQETKEKMSIASKDYMKDKTWKNSHAAAMKKLIGQVFITDGVHNKRIALEELQALQVPWRKGMTRSTNRANRQT